jgi:hypothetical protein
MTGGTADRSAYVATVCYFSHSAVHKVGLAAQVKRRFFHVPHRKEEGSPSKSVSTGLEAEVSQKPFSSVQAATVLVASLRKPSTASDSAVGMLAVELTEMVT